jgi:hypothetical protein
MPRIVGPAEQRLWVHGHARRRFLLNGLGKPSETRYPRRFSVAEAERSPHSFLLLQIAQDYKPTPELDPLWQQREQWARQRAIETTDVPEDHYETREDGSRVLHGYIPVGPLLDERLTAFFRLVTGVETARIGWYGLEFYSYREGLPVLINKQECTAYLPYWIDLLDAWELARRAARVLWEWVGATEMAAGEHASLDRAPFPEH